MSELIFFVFLINFAILFAISVKILLVFLIEFYWKLEIFQ
jgi:hypothetical protein